MFSHQNNVIVGYYYYFFLHHNMVYQEEFLCCLMMINCAAELTRLDCIEWGGRRGNFKKEEKEEKSCLNICSWCV